MLKLPSKLNLFLVLALASLVLVQVVGFYGEREAADALAWRKRTQEAQLAISEVNERKDHTESLVREFVLTGTEPLAVRAEKNFAEIHRRLAHARQLTGDNPNQVRRLTRLDATLKELTERWTTTLSTRRTQGAAAASQLVADGSGRRLTDEAEFLLDEMEEEESRLLEERSARAERFSMVSSVAMKLGGGLTLLFGFLAWRALLKQSRDREAADAQKLEAVAQFRALMENSPDAIWINQDRSIVFANPAFARLLGLPSAEQALGSSPVSFVRSDFQEIVRERTRRLEAGQRVEPIELVYVRADGTELPVEVRAVPATFDGQPAIQVIARDLTERKRAEQALRDSEENLAVTLQSIGDAVLTTDATGRITRLNAVAEVLTGWTQAEAAGKPVAEVFHIVNEGTRQPAFLPVADTLAKGTIHGLANHTVLIARDGTERPIADSCAPIRNRDGEVIGAVLVFRDVTQEKLAEQAIRESEARYRTLFDSIDEGYCIIEMIFDAQEKPVDYRFMQINPAFEKQTGMRDALGKRMRELAPQHEEHWFETFGRIAATGEPARFQNYAEALQRWFDYYAFRFGEPKNRQVGIIFSDITGRKQMEEAIRASEALNRAVLNSVMANIAVVDKHGTIIVVNEGWERFARENGADPRSPIVGVGANYLEVCERAAAGMGTRRRRF